MRAEPTEALAPAAVRSRVLPSVHRGCQQAWSIEDLRWHELRPDDLSEQDRSVVRYITFIEDHIPGYLAWLLDAFPTVGAIDPAEYRINREYFRFFIAWAYDEERHAGALTRYQLEAGMATEDDLLGELAAEGVKRFDIPYEHPLQAFTYTLVQEKATQFFYQRFHQVATEPVLKRLLELLGRDEARHFALYSQLVRAYLHRDGVKAVPHLKDVLNEFRMPLADTLTDYWRWSFRVSGYVGYDHTEAYEALVRLVDDIVDAPGDIGVDELGSFVRAVRRLP
jgi:hypothetical protein